MPYSVIESFGAGLDRRKSREIGVPGSLWELTNAHINAGGEIEKRKKFDDYAMLPTNTFGLQSNGTNLYVFGSAAPPTMPAGVLYQQLSHPSAFSMSDVLDSSMFAGKLYAIAKYVDGSIHHFYDGVRLADWDGGANLPTGKGVYCRTFGNKVYSLYSTIAQYCKLNDPTEWDTTTLGAGFNDLSNTDDEVGELMAVVPYQELVAFLSRNLIQVWNIDVDPTLNERKMSVGNTGTVAKRSAIPLGNSDIVYLADSGIRSLRARDSQNLASVEDIGTAIDELVKADLRTLSSTIVEGACSAVEPTDNRLMVALGNTIYAFSYFRSSKISAWSTYDMGAQVKRWQVHKRGLYARVGDTVKIYGGVNKNTYDTTAEDNYPVTVSTPFMSFGRVADDKVITGYDLGSVTGTWDVYLLHDPRDANRYTKLGSVSEITTVMRQLAASGRSTQFALKLVNTTPGAAKIGNLIVHYELDR